MSTGYVVIVVVAMVCTTFVVVFKISADKSFPESNKDGLSDFDTAKCTLPHEDGTACIPTKFGPKYVCFYREARGSGMVRSEERKGI
jgi:hypothetical protein